MDTGWPTIRRPWPVWALLLAALWVALPSAHAQIAAPEYIADRPELLVQVVQGWGELGYNVAAHLSDRTGEPLRIGGISYSKGLGHHASGRLALLLDGEFDVFEAEVGLQPCGTSGTVIFRVLVDGEPRFDSGIMRTNDPRPPGASPDPVAALVASLPPEFSACSHLAQDQYLEIRTLLSGYLLSSQGDRMLMAHSVEGRFPFLDRNVVALANSLPASYKLHVLDEKHVLKRAAEGLMPPEILRRPKQPYRVPDASAFVGRGAPDWVGDVLSERALEGAGVFDPQAARRVYLKCLSHADAGPVSNADNMATRRYRLNTASPPGLRRHDTPVRISCNKVRLMG